MQFCPTVQTEGERINKSVNFAVVGILVVKSGYWRFVYIKKLVSFLDLLKYIKAVFLYNNEHE